VRRFAGRRCEKGREGLKELLTIIADESDERLPIDARASLIVLAAQLQALHTMISSIERRLTVQHRASEESKRVATVPGIGTLGASAITSIHGTKYECRHVRLAAAFGG
jgi:transposase